VGRDPGHVRASNAERERVAELLADHWREGRLDLETFDARTARAYSAETVQDLEALVADLPGPFPIAPPPPPRRRRRRRRLWRLPGLLPFEEEVVLRGAREHTYDEAMRQIAPKLSHAGYGLVHTERPDMLRFSHQTHFLDVEKAITITFHDEPGGGTRVIAFGEAPRSVRMAFATMSD
jgi:Domain of unknown function (DUF1707)